MIREASLWDLMYVSANMRDIDRAEILPMRWDDDLERLAVEAYQWPGLRYACIGPGGLPVAVAGMAYHRPGVGGAWAWGTAAFREHRMEITRAARRGLAALFASGTVHRIEAASWAGHREAHQWLRILGFRRESVLPRYGRGGEDYELFVRIQEAA